MLGRNRKRWGEMSRGTLLPELVEEEKLIISALTEFLTNRLQSRPVADEGCTSDDTRDALLARDRQLEWGNASCGKGIAVLRRCKMRCCSYGASALQRHGVRVRQCGNKSGPCAGEGLEKRGNFSRIEDAAKGVCRGRLAQLPILRWKGETVSFRVRDNL